MLPDSFKAAYLKEGKKPLVIENISLKGNLVDGQVAVKIERSGICGKQLNEIDEISGPDKFLPHLLGHEGVGEVVEISNKVTKVKIGDRVVVHWRPGRGLSPSPATFTNHKFDINAGPTTTFSEFTVVCESRVTKIPESLSSNISALLGCALTTSYGVVFNDAKAKPGQCVVIFGAGGVGLSTLLMAKLANLSPIVMIDIDEKKLDISRKIGADFSILFKSSSQVIDDLNKIVNLNYINIVIETSGNKKAMETAYTAGNNTSKIIFVGIPNVNEKIEIYTLPLHFGKTIIGSHGGDSNPDTDIPNLINLINNKIIDCELLPIVEFKFEEINEAITSLRNGTPGRHVLIM